MSIPTVVADTAISVAAHLEAELEEALAEHRLTRASFLVLDALDRAEGGTLGQRELVSRVRRTSGTLSVRLGRLERARHDRARARPREPPQRDGHADRAGPARWSRRRGPPTPSGRRDWARACPRSSRAGSGRAAPCAGWPSSSPTSATAPRLGVAVAGAAVAKRMRRAVGLPDVPGCSSSGSARDSAGRARPESGRGDLITGAGRASGALDRRPRPCRAQRRRVTEARRPARRRPARARGELQVVRATLALIAYRVAARRTGACRSG